MLKHLNWLRSPTQRKGKMVEDQALAYMQQQGLRLVQRNFRSRSGEVDLIMREGQLLVFIEVRFRNHSRFGSGAESVNRLKQKKLIQTALYFLQTEHHQAWPACRFDVLAAEPDAGAQTSLHFDWIKNAFDLQ